MTDDSKKYLKILMTVLVVVLAASLLASWIQSGKGTVRVDEIRFYGSYDGLYSGYLYIPKNISTGEKAPGILAIHGFNNDKEYMSNTALELARRGYIVLTMDLDKHGMSASSNTPSSSDNAFGALDGMKYLKSLDIVDQDNIGLIGMSMGGLAVEGVALAMPDSYKSIFYMDSNPGKTESLKNFAMSWGRASEVPQPWGAKNGSEIVNMPDAMKAYGTDQAIVPGKIYGALEEGTGRVYYTHFGNHPFSTDDPVSIGNAIRWVDLTLDGKTNQNLSPSSQIWPIKVVATGIGFIGMVILLILFGGILLNTKFFRPLREELPEYKGHSGKRWWLFAAITTLLGPLTLYNLFLFFFMKNYFHLEGVATGFAGWLFVLGLLTVAILIIGHVTLGKKSGINGVHYGITWEGEGLNFKKIGKSAFLAFIVVVSGYTLLFLIKSWLKVDFRFWVLVLKVTDLKHFFIMLAYLIPIAVYFIPISVVLHGTLRPQNGTATVAKEIVTNILVMLLGTVGMLAYFYIPLTFFGGPAAFGPGGLGIINAIALIGLLPTVAAISTFFFRKTGHIYLGAFINTMFITWYLVAANALYSFGG